MKNLMRVFLTILSCCGIQGQVISEPDDVTVCEGREAVFTCVLNSNIRSDDVQWYRFIKDTSTTEMVDPVGTNINFLTCTDRNTRNSSLTITNARKSYTGYFWAGTSSLNFCNASLTVLTIPPALTVSTTKNIGSSVVVQWDAVDDSLITTYTVTWTRDGDSLQVVTLTEQTSYTITGLTLDTVYTITVTAANMCGSGPEFSTTVSFLAVINEPDDVTICEGREAVFTCVLNSNIRSDDVQWYRFIKDNSTAVMVDPDEDNINFITDTNGNTTSSSLTITNVIKSYAGYFWVGTPSLNVCNASLSVLISPSDLSVSLEENIESLSVDLQWDVNDFLTTTYTVTWDSAESSLEVMILTEQTSYTITGLILDTVYTITVTAANDCGSGPEYRNSIMLSTDVTSNTSRIIPSVTASTNSMNITITNSSSTIVTATTNPITISTNANTTTIAVIIPSTTTTNSVITTENKNNVTTIPNINIKITTATVKLITDTVLLFTSPVETNMADKNDNIMSTHSTVAVGVITFAVTFILTIAITAIITFIVTYFCVKRKFEKAYDNNDNYLKKQSTQDQTLYEQVSLASHTVTKNDIELQPNPAYGTGPKMIMDKYPTYENCN